MDKHEQNTHRFKEATAIFGEDTMHALINAVVEKSERPLMCLPDKWRYKAIAAFRWTIRK